LKLPYIPGFLAFREVGFVVELINKLKDTAPQKLPQVILCDGNGILHTRGFGFACHLGVLVNIPTIGVGKTIFNVDGIHEDWIKDMSRKYLLKAGDFFLLEGNSGTVWGAALRSLDSAKNPVFVSIGHRISLETAVKIVDKVSKFRIPEPIRQADLRSRSVVRHHFEGV